MMGTVPVVSGVPVHAPGVAGVPIVNSPFGCGRPERPPPMPAVPVMPPPPVMPLPPPPELPAVELPLPALPLPPPSVFEPAGPDDEHPSANETVASAAIRAAVRAPCMFGLLDPFGGEEIGRG